MTRFAEDTISAAATAVAAAPDVADSERPVVEIGWILVGRFDKQLTTAVRLGQRQFAKRMRDAFADFEFLLPTMLQPDVQLPATCEATTLLDIGITEKDLKRWDFAFVVTAGDIKGYTRPTLLAAPSVVVGCAAVACGRIWEPCEDQNDTECVRIQTQLTATRLNNIATHLLGHLCGLPDRDDHAEFMHKPGGVFDLEQMRAFSDLSTLRLERELHAVADPRLEEHEDDAECEASATSRFRGHYGRFRFMMRAAALNFDDVWRATKRAQPWMFPVRLSRLTTAAVSTLLLLCITAEVWEAGMSQSIPRVLILGAAALLVTTPFLISRQQLLIHRPRRRSSRLSEQRSVGNVAITLAVFLGMLTTYTGLFAAAMTITWCFFPTDLVANWATSVQRPHTVWHYICLAGCVAAVGLLIGALGASFEPRGYMRHVAFVDEEV